MTSDLVCYAVLLRMDAETEAWLAKHTTDLHRLIGGSEQAAPNPHITAIPTDAVPGTPCLQRLRTLAETEPTVAIHFSYIGIFPNAGVVYVGPTVTHPLLQLHQRIAEAARPSAATPWIEFYDVDAWVPHCTLATDLRETHLLEALGAVTQQLLLPRSALVDSIEYVCVKRTGLQVLERLPLRGTRIASLPG